MTKADYGEDKKYICEKLHSIEAAQKEYAEKSDANDYRIISKVDGIKESCSTRSTNCHERYIDKKQFNLIGSIFFSILAILSTVIIGICTVINHNSTTIASNKENTIHNTIAIQENKDDIINVKRDISMFIKTMITTKNGDKAWLLLLKKERPGVDYMGPIDDEKTAVVGVP